MQSLGVCVRKDVGVRVSSEPPPFDSSPISKEVVMNKIFLIAILLLLSLSVVALSPADQELLIKQLPMDLTSSATRIPQIRLNDFSRSYRYEAVKEILPGIYIPIETDGYDKPYNAWYKADFSSDPFDGKIEIIPMGEPLPGGLISLCIGLAFAGIIMWKHNKVQPISE